MSRRLLQRQTSSSTEIQQPHPPVSELIGNRSIHELWLRNDNKQKTSETTKINENDVPSMTENTPTRPAFPSFLRPTAPTQSVQLAQPTNVTYDTPSNRNTLAAPNMQSRTDILILSPNMSSPASIRAQDDEQDVTLLNQLQVRRSRPEHSPSDLSPNFSPSFSPRFVPQSRPRTLLAYLQNFGQNNSLASQVANNTQQSNTTGTQGDPRRTAVSFFSRIFGNNPPTPPQNVQSGQNNNENTNTDEAVSTTNEITQYESAQQVTNTINDLSNGAIIVRTVQPGPNGSMIVNMRVLSLEDLLNQQEGPGNSELFGSLLNIFAGLQGVGMFTFSDLSRFISGERGLDKKTIQSLPAVTYEEEAFKNVESESKRCTICLDHFENGNEIKYLWCLHRFHTSCVDQWLDKHSNCPVCKKDYAEAEQISE